MRFLDHLKRSAIGELLERDGYFWLDLDAPSDADVATLDDLFHFHPPALEDLRKRRQRSTKSAPASTRFRRAPTRSTLTAIC